MDAKFSLSEKYRITFEKNGDGTCKVTYHGSFFDDELKDTIHGKVIYPRVAGINMAANYAELYYGVSFIRHVGGKVLPDENGEVFYFIMEENNL